LSYDNPYSWVWRQNRRDVIVPVTQDHVDVKSTVRLGGGNKTNRKILARKNATVDILKQNISWQLVLVEASHVAPLVFPPSRGAIALGGLHRKKQIQRFSNKDKAGVKCNGMMFRCFIFTKNLKVVGATTYQVAAPVSYPVEYTRNGPFYQCIFSFKQK